MMGPAFALAMAGAASAHQAATASHEQNSQQRAGRRRRTSADPQRAQQGATAAAAPAALDSLSRLQQLADASPQVAKLRRLQALADGQFAPVAQLAGGPEEEDLVQGKFASTELQPQLQQAPCANNTGLPDQLSDRDTFLPMPAQNLDGRLSLPTIRKRCVAERSPAQRFEKPNRTGLPDALKSGVEALSGLSLDQVRVHRNSPKPAQLNAHAYAQGSDIHLAPGQEKHLPHEAWHIVQQAQGRVKPTAQLKGIALNDDSALEREADVMGQAALRPTVSRSQAPLFPPRSSPRVAPVQALFYFRSSGGETRLADVDLVVSLLQESGYVPENDMNLAELVKKLSQGPDIFFGDQRELVGRVEGRLSGRAGAAFALAKAAGGSPFRKTYRLFGAIIPLRGALTDLQHARAPAVPMSASAATTSAMSLTPSPAMSLSAAAASSSSTPKAASAASASSASSAPASASAAAPDRTFASMLAAADSFIPDMQFLLHEPDATLRGYKAKEILRDCDIILTDFSALLDEHPAHGDFRHFWACFNILSNFGPLSYAIIEDARASGVAASQLGELKRFADFILENLRDIRQGLSRRPTLAIIAHRGTGPTNRNMGGLITLTDARRTRRLAENSPDAFGYALSVTREALRRSQPSLDGIECDVYLSSNLVPMVTHEAKVLEQLNRAQQDAARALPLTPHTEVHELTDVQLKSIPRNTSAGSRFMTLAELLDLARDTAIDYFRCTGRAFRIEIEMKGTKAETAAGHGPLQLGALRDATARVVSQAVKRNRRVPVEYVLFNGTPADLPGFSALRQTKTGLGGLFTGFGGESTLPDGMNPAHVDELRYGFNKDPQRRSGPLLPNTRTNLRHFIVTLVFAQEFAPQHLADRFEEPSEDIFTGARRHTAVSDDIARRASGKPTSTELNHITLFAVLRQMPPDLRLHLLTDYPGLANWIKTELTGEGAASADESAASSSSGRFGSGSPEHKESGQFVPEPGELRYPVRYAAAAAAAAATQEEEHEEPATASRSSGGSSSSNQSRGGSGSRGRGGQRRGGGGQNRGGGQQHRGGGRSRGGGGGKPSGKSDKR